MRIHGLLGENRQDIERMAREGYGSPADGYSLLVEVVNLTKGVCNDGWFGDVEITEIREKKNLPFWLAFLAKLMRKFS